MKVSGSKTIKRGILVLAAVMLSVFLFSSIAGAMGWGLWVVDSNSGVGRDTSIEFDPNDVPHVSYYDAGNQDLKYAVWNESSGIWQYEPVDTRGKVGKDTSIDSSGNISISYYDDTSKSLKFAWQDAFGWQYVTVDAGGGASDDEVDDSSSDDNSSSEEDKYDVGEDTSLEINAAGDAYISYYNDTSRDLKVARSVGSGGNCGEGAAAGMWQCDTVDAAGDVGEFTSLAIDFNGIVHVSYYDASNRNLKHAWQVDGGGNCGVGDVAGMWMCETVDNSAKVGKYSSLAIGMDGYPKIAYEDEGNHDLKFACYNGSTWNLSTIDSAGDVGEDVSLAIGKDGRPRIAYHNDDDDALFFATKFEVCGAPGGTWVSQVIDDNGRVGEDNSLALDSNDNPCVSYHDEDNGNLKVACWQTLPPELSLTCPTGNGVRWETMGDYQNRELSVDYTLTNNAAAYAYDVNITASPADGGVTLSTGLPYLVSSGLDIGASVTFTLRFHVPAGVMMYQTSTHATVRDEAGSLYYYPCKSPLP